MPKLKSLFGGGNIRKSEEEAAVAENMSTSNTKCSSSRSPSVVARLMGLEMLPGPGPSSAKALSEKKVLLEKRVPDSNTLVDITVSGKQLNVVTGRNTRKSKSFDEAFSKLEPSQQQQQEQRDKQRRSSVDLQVCAAPQEAECLQSIQLEELNKQLMAKHLQVLDELNEARQQRSYDRTSEKQQQQSRPSKGLSDSTEFLDAVELLQANRQFFEKYFQNTSALQSMLRKDESQTRREHRLKVANRIPQYLSGHSSPRPPSRDFEQNAELNRDEKQGSSIVVLKPRKSGKALSKPEEKPVAKDTKDIAKIIAKKIKESITKEVAKTFYSKLDTAVSPQKGSPGRNNFGTSDSESAPRKKQASQGGRKKSLDVNERKKVDLQSPRAKRQSNGSPTKQQLCKAGSEVPEDGIKLDCSKNARVLRNQRSSAEKKLSDPKSSPARAVVKSRVADSSPRLAGDNTPRALKQKSAPSASPKILKNERKTKPLKETVRDVDVHAEGDHFELSVDFATPTKTEKDPAAIDLNDTNKSSPVSVLELIDDDEDDDLIVKTVDIISCSISQEQQQQSELIRRCEEPDQAQPAALKQEEPELTCPPGREDDFIYLRKLVAASSRDGVFEPVLDPSLFEALEEEYNQQQSEEMFVEPVRAQVRAVNRWLIFDAVNEFLSREWCGGMKRLVRSERLALRQLWSGICDHSVLQKSSESLQSLARFDLSSAGTWDEGSVPEMCQQLEIALINNLIDEAMAEFLKC